MPKDPKVKSMSEKIEKREVRIKILRVALLISALFLIIIYFILRVIYEGGGFTVSLDRDFSRKRGIVIYEHLADKDEKIALSAQKLEFADNISIDWLPENLNDVAEGSHNGDNYLAYTFYVENEGSDTVNYWYSILIDDVIKDVDKAIRIMVYQNGENIVYAKPNSSGNPEFGTTPFKSETKAMVKQRASFNPGEIDKFTIVVWIEGDDPDCVDYLIGGEIKMHMEIAEEFVN